MDNQLTTETKVEFLVSLNLVGCEVRDTFTLGDLGFTEEELKGKTSAELDTCAELYEGISEQFDEWSSDYVNKGWGLVGAEQIEDLGRNCQREGDISMEKDILMGDYDDMEFTDVSWPTCPYCGYSQDECFMDYNIVPDSTIKIECKNCEEEFQAKVYTKIVFSTVHPHDED